jgi:hypothetical protein
MLPCRCHGMMRVPADQVGAFLAWTNEGTEKCLTVEDDFVMPSKIFASEYGEHHNDLVSFTTICPGSGPGKDAYWVVEDVCKHVVEVSHIFKWVHRVPGQAVQPKMFVIFDGSSNHKARSEDALHIGEGVCKRPGGKNAPGARSTKRYPEGVPKMRNGWYMDAHGNKIVQHMHRQQRSTVLQ